MTLFFKEMPKDVTLKIFELFEKNTLLTVRLVSKEWENYTTDKRLQYYFWKKEPTNSWQAKNGQGGNIDLAKSEPTKISYLQARYKIRLKNSDLKSIVINLRRNSSEIFFHGIKNAAAFEKIKKNCELDKILNDMKDCGTKDCLAALEALEEFLPAKLLKRIYEDLQEGKKILHPDTPAYSPFHKLK